MRKAEEELEELDAAHLRRRLRWTTNSGADGPALEVDGSRLIDFASNDYLGLGQSPELRRIVADSLACHGPGAGASRLVTGSKTAHRDLEATLAAAKGKEAALSFSSGYATAVGVLDALLGAGDVVLLDKLSHASLIDGAKLSGARVRVFAHNDLDQLEDKLRRSSERIDSDGRILVVTEAVFSMDGDRAPLREIVEITKRYGALLLVDEAHSFGVIGPQGRGLGAELEIEAAIDFQMGTLSKAVGLSGGFVACSQVHADLLINRARSFIYSTAPPPFLAASAARAVDLMLSPHGDALRSRLKVNLDGFALASPSMSAIIPVRIGGEVQAMDLARELQQEGFLVPAIRYPTVARGAARLRIVVSAAHELAQIEALVSHLRGKAELF